MDSDQRGGGRGITGERGGKANQGTGIEYSWVHMMEGIDCGNGGVWGRGEQWGKRQDNCN